jgi:endonuclease-3
LALKSFSIDYALSVVKQENKQWRRPVVAHYADTPFTVLISCLLSLRTQDKTTDAASARIFKLAKTPKAMRRLSVAKIQKAIYPVSFYKTKARSIKKICDILVETYGGRVPQHMNELLELPGVGRKTANLVITEGFQKPGICVDTHVHRIMNRWGYVKTKMPDETEMVLRRRLPSGYWIGINELLVTYGQNLCKPISPHCSQCRLGLVCPRLGVTSSR